MDSLARVLRIASDGKLEMLQLAGQRNLLFEWDQEVALGGRMYRPAGWDECFPTIEPTALSPVMGDLVGRAPQTIWNETSVQQRWRTDHFEARRCFSLESESSMVVTFSVTNLHHAKLEYLWASHALFDVSAAVTVHLPDDIILDDFTRNNSEKKFFVANTNSIELAYEGFRVRLETDQPWWGIWLNRGGWPDPAAMSSAYPSPICLGVEATNTPAERPDRQWLGAGETFTGHVSVDICLE
jgi:hypothetical protein